MEQIWTCAFNIFEVSSSTLLIKIHIKNNSLRIRKQKKKSLSRRKVYTLNVFIIFGIKNSGTYLDVYHTQYFWVHYFNLHLVLM